MAGEFGGKTIVANVRETRVQIHSNVPCCQRTVVHSVPVFQLQRNCHKNSTIASAEYTSLPSLELIVAKMVSTLYITIFGLGFLSKAPWSSGCDGRQVWALGDCCQRARGTGFKSAANKTVFRGHLKESCSQRTVVHSVPVFQLWNQLFISKHQRCKRLGMDN